MLRCRVLSRELSRLEITSEKVFTGAGQLQDGAFEVDRVLVILQPAVLLQRAQKLAGVGALLFGANGTARLEGQGVAQVGRGQRLQDDADDEVASERLRNSRRWGRARGRRGCAMTAAQRFLSDRVSESRRIALSCQ